MKNKMTRAIGLSIVAAGFAAGSVQAADTVTGSASVVVLSAISMVETTAISFGTIAAFADGTTAGTISTLTIPADGSAQSIVDAGTAKIVEIAAGNAATYTISGAAPNTVITITLPDEVGGYVLGDVLLTDPAAVSDDEFYIDNFTKSIVTSGTAFTYDTDGTGTLVFNVGADLLTTDQGFLIGDLGAPYDDATYTGTYDVTVSY